MLHIKKLDELILKQNFRDLFPFFWLPFKFVDENTISFYKNAFQSVNYVFNQKEVFPAFILHKIYKLHKISCGAPLMDF